MADEQGDERVALIALLKAATARKMSWASVVTAVLDADGTAPVWDRLAPPTLLGNDEADSYRDDARRIVAEWDRAGDRFVTVLDADYPPQLREIREAPPFLFYEGGLRHDDAAVSVVGSRSASASGLAIATELATRLATAGLTVAAGLAAGIDTAAHVGALDAGGRTVAVIGTGIRRTYPAANRELQTTIGRHGLVLSQFYPEAPPQRHHFPQRNATMSGYGIATIVVEAGEHSGARIQARKAVEHGRPVILTNLVLDRTDWAKDLRHRSGVHIASSADQAMEIVDTVRQEDDELATTAGE